MAIEQVRGGGVHLLAVEVISQRELDRVLGELHRLRRLVHKMAWGGHHTRERHIWRSRLAWSTRARQRVGSHA